MRSFPKLLAKGTWAPATLPQAPQMFAGGCQVPGRRQQGSPGRAFSELSELVLWFGGGQASVANPVHSQGGPLSQWFPSAALTLARSCPLRHLGGNCSTPRAAQSPLGHLGAFQ